MQNKDRERLRKLAARQMELANSPLNLERVAEWKRHNAAIQGRPIVHVELDTFEHEVIDPILECTSEDSRRLERDLLRGFLNLELFDDDWVVNDYFGISWDSYFYLFGYDISRTTATDSNGISLGHHFNHVITDLEEEYQKLGASKFGVDEASTTRYRQLAEDAFGDILPVRMTMGSPQAVPTQKLVHLMGMEAMFYNMSDYPELFSTMMQRVADDYTAYLRFMESGGYLCSTTAGELLNQGSRCFTAELTPKPAPQLKDLWGFMDSQESVGLSPQMFAELVFPCYRQIAGLFGLLSYGCCEAVSPVWSCIKTLPNLRKVSVSPWCDQRYMGEQLRGGKVIFHRKPNPTFLGVGAALDEDALTAHIRETLDAAQGCVVEFTQRDVYTIHHDTAKVKRYVEIVRALGAQWAGL